MPTVVHLTASTFYGGPERQMCGLACALPRHYRSVFISFAEGGRCQAFLDEVGRQGFETIALEHDTPKVRAALQCLVTALKWIEADVLCCHGYKADLLGRPAARRLGIPVVAVSRGWTGANLKVRLYEMLDKFSLRWMDRVICVSEGQAVRVRCAGVPARKVVVIRNAIRADRFARPDVRFRNRLQAYFPSPRRKIVGAAGRLSPEKGFDLLVRVAEPLVRVDPSLGFILFGDGPLRNKLAGQIAAANLTDHVILAGFRNDLDHYLPFLDLLVLPSHTEGLPNVVLEASAAGIPVVATAVGGTPEVIEDGVSGFLVRPGDTAALGKRIAQVLASPDEGRAMGAEGRRIVRDCFSFEAQSEQYQRFFETVFARSLAG
jgi:glycosyltransferase involved in cell wall biosynthesis